jgi:glycosyltransferase involved in cell wall biosynthesis
MTQKRYLIFDAYYGTSGGNQRYIRMLFAEARRDGWRPILACPGEGRLPDSVRETGGEVHVIPQPERLDRYSGTVLRAGAMSRIASLFALVRYNFRIMPKLRELRPDVIQCHNIRSLLMVGLAARLLGIPTTLFIKAELCNPLLDRIAFALSKRVFFIATALMPSRRRSKFRKLRIGIDFAAVDATLARRTVEGDPEDHKEHLSFAFAGWLVPAKGVHVLIDAFERVTHQVSDVRLDIVGEGDDAEYRQELANVVEWQNLGERVTFHGWRDDVLDAIDAADIYVMPSFTEGVPRSIVEAMALGKPIVSTNVGGVPELLEGGEIGLMVAPGDSTVLAAAMLEIAGDRELRKRLAARGIETARGKYSFAAHLAQLESYLAEVSGPECSATSSEGVGASA